MQADDNAFRNTIGRQQMSEIAFSAAIGAALMLYFGWGFSWFRPADQSLYSLSILGFMWLLRVGGILMALAAVGLWIGLRPILAYDAFVAILTGLLMILIGGLWLARLDMEGILLLIFGVLFTRSGWGSWQAFRGVSIEHAFPVAPEIETSSTPPPTVLTDPATRQAAMDRLLANKRREASVEYADQRTEPPQPPVEARPPVTEQRRTLIEDEPPATVTPQQSEPARAAASKQIAAPQEPPPDGFLAQLGREDAQRK